MREGELTSGVENAKSISLAPPFYYPEPISTGRSLSIRDIIYYVFDKFEISKDRIVTNQEYFRPNEIDVTIKEMAETMKEVVGFKGNLTFDTIKPDGSPRKLIDVSRLSNTN